jgi:ankyrin repeat protein
VELIKKWKIDDKLFYDETGGFTAALEMVQSNKYMTIIGGPASGKTATARHIALQLEEQRWEVVPVCRLEEIIHYGDRDHKQVFVLDDVLGIFAVDMHIYNHIINHKEPIFNAIGGTSKLLFTCRKSVYKEAFKLALFVTENVLDLQSKDNQLTETEKMAICQYHCKSKDVKPDRYTSLSFTKANHMFPFLCKLFSMEEQYQRLGESFFNKPFEYFIKELDKLQVTHTIQYAVLVLCLVNEGKLSVEHLPPKHKQKEVFNNCGINLVISDKTIKDAIYHQSETYFTKLDTEYTFAHDFIFEVIAYHYGCQNKHQILKYLSSSYIANKLIVFDQASNENLCIHISEDMYLPLAERLYTDIQSMNLFDVVMNKSLKHGPFLDVFEAMLKTKPFDEFESLILRKRENIHHFVHTTFSVKRPHQQMIGGIEYNRLHLLFDSVLHVESGPEYNVMVISWIINYGHTHLLQEIVNHVECNNNSTSLVFGSDIMENRRMLSLGCYSNNLDMVELILKYVDPKCIDVYVASFMIPRGVNAHVTPLIVACSIGNLRIVKLLLGNHADIDKCNRWNESPLYTASNHGHCEVVKCLLNSGADINLGNSLGQSPLFGASQRGYCDIVKCLFSYGADINLCDISEQSPLFVASKGGYYDVVKCLLSSGADINLGDSLGQSPLFGASQRGYCDIVKCLFSYGADISLCDISEQSPLFVASQKGHCVVVKCLLISGADINVCDNYGRSPLLVASAEGHCDVVKCLLSSGGDINGCDKVGQSPLFVASISGYCAIVKCLLSSGAAINLCDVVGQSPLFAASMYGQCDIAKCLLSYDADINLRDVDGQTPSHAASSSGYYDIVRLLTVHAALRNETESNA